MTKRSTISMKASNGKRPKDLAQEAHIDAESIVATIREPLLVLDGNLRVKSANRSFYESFHVQPEETENRLIYDLGNSQWDTPSLRTLLEELLPKNTELRDFEVEHEFPIIGRRVMQLNARQLHHGEAGMPLILLAIEDVTERKRATELRITETDAFIYSVSHGLKERMRTMEAFSQFL